MIFLLFAYEHAGIRNGAEHFEGIFDSLEEAQHEYHYRFNSKYKRGHVAVIKDKKLEIIAYVFPDEDAEQGLKWNTKEVSI